MKTRILLVDDHRIMRQGLRAMIEREDGLEVVGEAEDGRAAVRLARELNPELVLMDVAMPNLNGIEATRMIREELPRTRVVALSMHTDRQFVAHMLEAGACGYLLKDCAFEELISAIKAVLAGQTYLSPAVAGVFVDDYVRRLPRKPTGEIRGLTRRECDVLSLLAEGKSTRQIAAELGVSPKTVETHRRNIMEKLDIHTVAELTKYALRRGLTSLEK